MNLATHGDHRHPIARHEKADRIAGGAILIALGALALLVSGGEPERNAEERAAPAAAIEDWHGNVRASNWPNE